MKKLVAGIMAVLLLTGAVVFANSDSAKKADCCAQGKACCYPGSSCCSR